MSECILKRRGTFASFLAYINVSNAYPNSIVTATGNRIYKATSDSSGNATITVKKEGTYIISCVHRENSGSVTISTYGETKTVTLVPSAEYSDFYDWVEHDTRITPSPYFSLNFGYVSGLHYEMSFIIKESTSTIPTIINASNFYGYVTGNSYQFAYSEVFEPNRINNVITSGKNTLDVALFTGYPSVTVNSTTIYPTRNGSYSTRGIALLYANVTDVYRWRLYRTKLYSDNTHNNLFLDLRPRIRTSDNTIGLYDTVNNVFYTASRGGDRLTIGND